jgi:hypothetical protein
VPGLRAPVCPEARAGAVQHLWAYLAGTGLRREGCALAVSPDFYPHYAREGDVVRLRRSPELVGRVLAERGGCLMVSAIGRRGLNGLFYAEQLELVPGQEEVFEA